MIVAIWLYGGFRFKEGYLTAEKDLAAMSAQSQSKAARELERITNETAHLDDSAIDDSLRSLGIVRQPEDR